jgi:hypothetical protein
VWCSDFHEKVTWTTEWKEIRSKKEHSERERRQSNRTK